MTYITIYHFIFFSTLAQLPTLEIFWLSTLERIFLGRHSLVRTTNANLCMTLLELSSSQCYKLKDDVWLHVAPG